MMLYFLWSRGRDKTQTFETLFEQLVYIDIAVVKLKGISSYDDKKLLTVRL